MTNYKKYYEVRLVIVVGYVASHTRGCELGGSEKHAFEKHFDLTSEFTIILKIVLILSSEK